MATQYQVVTYTNNASKAVWYLLEQSVDGVNFFPVMSNDTKTWPYGYVVSQVQATVVTAMNTYHQAVLNDLSNPANWAAGAIVAGPV